MSDFLFKTLGLVLFVFLFPHLAIGHVGGVDFEVERGDGFAVVAQKLQKLDLIKSTTWFKMYSLLTGSAHLFKPGLYHIQPQMGVPQIVRLLVIGPEDVRVTIQEGETLMDIEKKLAEAQIIKAGELVRFNQNRKLSLEGFLFPDTYYFQQFSPIERVVDKFLDNYKKKIGSVDYNNLILASLIEKEVIHPQDRLLAAGVLKRRLALGMPLQVDATIVYVKCGGSFVSCDDEARHLNTKDLKIKSSYNTYLNTGLPPTPIANPGKEAIMAALNPQKSKYLYYISDPKTGRVVFAQTLDEHNENRFKYLR